MSSANFRSILIFASCVVGTCNILEVIYNKYRTSNIFIPFLSSRGWGKKIKTIKTKDTDVLRFRSTGAGECRQPCKALVTIIIIQRVAQRQKGDEVRATRFVRQSLRIDLWLAFALARRHYSTVARWRDLSRNGSGLSLVRRFTGFGVMLPGTLRIGLGLIVEEESNTAATMKMLHSSHGTKR